MPLLIRHFPTLFLGKQRILIGVASTLSMRLFNSLPSPKTISKATTHCAAPVWLTRCHTMPLIIRHFPTLFLGKQRILIGVASTLSMRLFSSFKNKKYYLEGSVHVIKFVTHHYISIPLTSN